MCMKGDEKKLKELYLHLFDRLMGICMRYKKDRTEAVSFVNIAFMKIIENLKKYDPDKNLKAWASRLTVNMLIDSYRKDKHRNKFVSIHDHDDNTAQNIGTPNWIVEELQAEYIRDCMKTLPRVTQTVFNLYAVDGFKHREIADKMNISIGTSKWHVSHARILLKDLLQKEDERKSKTYG
jgi:RNA polymerase sigma factor (sigma-70 family)